jgi:hypothetical protein
MTRSLTRRRARLGRLIAAILGLALGLPATAAANDSWQAALPLEPDGPALQGASGPATTAAGEPLTAVGPGSCAGQKVEKTLWYTIEGDGGLITVSARGSRTDTVVAVFETDADPQLQDLIDCNDDSDHEDWPYASELVFAGEAGVEYLVQLGGCVACGGLPSGGATEIVAYAQPTNDDRADAQPLTTNQPVTTDTRGATVQNGEQLACGGAAYGKTVWYRWIAPAQGEVRFTTSGYDTVLTSGAVCNDNAGASLASSVRRTVSQGQEVFIQVGGRGGGTASEDGPHTVQVGFAEDLDVDNDGVPRPLDCNDSNRAIRPGMPDRPENGIDEDCSGADAVVLDRDRDGADRPLDCNDNDASIRPGRVERRGNRTDENCDGVAEPYPLIRADVEHRFRVSARRSWVAVLSATRVPEGATVVVSCRGPRGGHDRCPFRRVRRVVAANARRIALAPLFWHRALPVGTLIEVRVTHPEEIGKSVRLRTRARQAPRRTLRCLVPGTQGRSRCA